jgi:hypothetical protein
MARAQPRFLAILALSAVAALSGCTNGHTAVVQLQTDLVPGLEFDEVFVQATGLRSRRASLREDYGRPVQVAEISGVAPGTDLAVEVSLRLGGREIVARRIQRRIQRDTILGVVVTRNCVEIACPSPSAPTATECRDGVCVPPDCEDRGSCVPDECSSDSECTSTIACVVPRCALGVCIETPDATRCRADEVCSPVGGCVRASAPDAAIADAGTPLDAALEPPDAFVPGPTFTLHFLPPGGSAWSEVSVAGDYPTTERVEGAFAPAGSGHLVVLTHSELFVLEPGTGRFLERRGRDAVLPELAGRYVWDAYTVGTDLFVSAERDTWIYTWSHESRSATFQRFIAQADLGDDWRGPLAPPWWEMYASFVVPDNAFGWARPDTTRSPCGAASISLHAVFLSTDGFGPRVMMETVYDGTCFQFVNSAYYGSGQYAPFAMPGAPADPFTIDAAEWQDGLWVFTSPR